MHSWRIHELVQLIQKQDEINQGYEDLNAQVEVLNGKVEELNQVKAQYDALASKRADR